MRIKKVNRCYCDFCAKANCSAPAMKKHEERCTMNPKRYCGYCHLLKQEQPDLQAIISLIPRPITVTNEFGTYEKYDGIKEVLPIVREKTGDCPACIMAVFRQAGIPLSVIDDFDFKAECKSIWDDFNDSHRYC